MGVVPWLEIRRKIWHAIPLAIPIWYQYLSKEQALTILLPFCVFYVLGDLLRHFHKGYAALFDRVITSHFLREREKTGLIGSTYFALGALSTIILFPKEIAITSIYILVISDGSAGIVGSAWGRTPLVKGKTLEGSIAFFVTGMIVITFTMWHNLIWGTVAVIGGTLAELLPFKLDDNLTIPLVVGGILMIGL